MQYEEDPILGTELRLVEGQARIIKQCQVIARLRKIGADISEATAFLENLQQVRETREDR